MADVIDTNDQFGNLEPLATDPSALLSTEDVLGKGRDIATSGIPLQLAGLMEALTALRARSTGSTAAIFPAIQGQLGVLRAQYAKASQELARKLGPAGGGYAEQGKTGLLNQSSQQYLQLLGQGQQQGVTGLLNTLGNVQPFLGVAARAPNVGTKDSPFNFAVAGTGLADTAKILGRLFAPGPTPFASAPVANSTATNFAGQTSLSGQNTFPTQNFSNFGETPTLFDANTPFS